MDHSDDFLELELELACCTDSDSEVDLWIDQDQDVEIKLELSDDDHFHGGELSQIAKLDASPDIFSTFESEHEDDPEPSQAEPGSSGDEKDLRDETLKSLEDFVFSFLTKLSEALPSAYSQSKGQPSNQKKITLHLADRRKESSDGHVQCCRIDTSPDF
ncbi:hypothetical protein GSI_03928 [Ganoderma sinense ZZ0214-1]|uniref:Uncharacterized protein n=1 Tax=Ganoderma sinense ZZ0214-1 TaxID=1077348 RepID=A0A2G8SKF0_9APHY|nr:hypothetical protein GSI_03928 [Ganoderma sinense ZZ0214-1]